MSARYAWLLFCKQIKGGDCRPAGEKCVAASNICAVRQAREVHWLRTTNKSISTDLSPTSGDASDAGAQRHLGSLSPFTRQGSGERS